jgi:hypothetical protein
MMARTADRTDRRETSGLIQQAVRGDQRAPGELLGRRRERRGGRRARPRAGQYQKAIDVLRPNLDRQDDGTLAIDLFFLAMSHHTLGEIARARDYYDWVIRWTGALGRLRAEDEEDLKLFRAEAEEVFRINNK